MRCPYCYNVKLWNGEEEDGDLEVDEVIDFMRSREGRGPSGRFLKVEWLVFSGGECSLHPEVLKRLLEESKSIGLKNCVYTNGTVEGSSGRLKELLKDGLVQAINLDYKWDVHHSEYPYSKVSEWINSLTVSIGALEMNLLEKLRINTTLLKSYHTSEVLKSMKSLMFKVLRPYEEPIVGARLIEGWKNRFSWTLESFFDGGGKIPTLEKVNSMEALSDREIAELIGNL
jgi:pyruvate-formate lyase-activating enzyme